MVQAVLAIEDRRFYDHPGVDLIRTIGAVITNLRGEKKYLVGGSTITQQLVKNFFLTPKKTLRRKLAEQYMALILERRVSKDQILEMYLNDVYLGQRGSFAVHGVAEAARLFFGKDISNVTLNESATIAGIIQSPYTWSPFSSPERCRERRNVVLRAMADEGFISQDAARRTSSEPILVVQRALEAQAPYFVDYVQQEIARRGDEDTDADPAGLITTLDVPLQRFAESAVARGLDELETRVPRLRPRGAGERVQVVLLAVDPATGGIRALVGGRDYRTSPYNRAGLARRQPGSAFKPFVYLAALSARENGPAFTLASHVEDAPVTLNVDGKPWTPRNYSDRYEGEVSVRRALEASLNGATVRIAQTVGLPAIIDAARRMGIESDLKPVPAIALGAFEVTPVELARAYIPFAAGGQARPVSALASDGRAEEPPRQAISPAEAYLLTAALQGVIDTGTGAGVRAMGLDAPVAGKTGTTNEGRDAWFVGYSSNLVTLVWVGFDDGRPLGLSGAEAAAPMWTEFMKRALAMYPPTPFAPPDGVETARIDPTTGKRATEACPEVRTEVFLVGSEPGLCELHGTVVDRVHRWWDRVWDWFRR